MNRAFKICTTIGKFSFKKLFNEQKKIQKIILHAFDKYYAPEE